MKGIKKIGRISKEELITSGIAKRMIDFLNQHRGTQDSEINCAPEECEFWVQKKKIDVSDVEAWGRKKCVIIAIELPGEVNPIFFDAMRGYPFGAADDLPLSEKQLELLRL